MLLQKTNGPVSILLTNALTGWEPPSKPKTFLFPEFKEESDAADHIKRDVPILVILGNPPYDGFAGIAIGEERRLFEAYRDPIDPQLGDHKGKVVTSCMSAFTVWRNDVS